MKTKRKKKKEAKRKNYVRNRTPDFRLTGPKALPLGNVEHKQIERNFIIKTFKPY